VLLVGEMTPGLDPSSLSSSRSSIRREKTTHSSEHRRISFDYPWTHLPMLVRGLYIYLPTRSRKFIAIVFASTFITIAYLRSTNSLTGQLTENIIDNQRRNEQVTYLPPIGNNPTLTSSIIVPKNPRIYFIHVGKAGGTTVVTALRLKEIAGNSSVHHGILCKDKRGISYCYNQSSTSDDISQLTKHILGYFHLKGGGQNHKYQKGRTWLLKKIFDPPIA
jgi:hypothetical protein